MTSEDPSMEPIEERLMKLVLLIEKLEARDARIATQQERGVEALRAAAKESAQLAKQLASGTASSFQQVAGDALRQGIAGAVREATGQLEASMREVRRAAGELQTGLDRSQRIHQSVAWKAFIACAVGSVFVVAACAYAVMTARTALTRSDWTSLINAATEAGHLAPCEKGGLCARIDGKRWVRIDRAERQAK
ncbi:MULTISPECIES: hypothetical protein [Dyella]|uniref:Uncharacterized protein n=2 Tax=Dyella TaxID=231454 RepID=A0A4R0YIF3_9GAMM|nr:MULTISPECIES: hypothetical protein [Dyella]TBR36740.1 hypothetical protein EYV96_12555 [Dyella terrae]TCI08169.1 hypothetical protein EZM97_26315 [Dyella soli]